MGNNILTCMYIPTYLLGIYIHTYIPISYLISYLIINNYLDWIFKYVLKIKLDFVVKLLDLDLNTYLPNLELWLGGLGLA
jgi:hypothetical protein